VIVRDEWIIKIQTMLRVMSSVQGGTNSLNTDMMWVREFKASTLGTLDNNL
jgi:hypothetical protein